MKTKFVVIIKRALAGIVIIPVTAMLWTLGYAMLVGLGAEATSTANQVFSTGIMVGVILTLWLMFLEPLDKLIDKLDEKMTRS